MQDGRTDTRISTSSLPASRHDCPQYSCPFATLQRHGMCAHCFVIRFAISNSPVEKALTLYRLHAVLQRQASPQAQVFQELGICDRKT